jgi:hypothetical protein
MEMVLNRKAKWQACRVPDKISKGTIGLYGASCKMCLRTKRALVGVALQHSRQVDRALMLEGKPVIDRSTEELANDILRVSGELFWPRDPRVVLSTVLPPDGSNK